MASGILERRKPWLGKYGKEEENLKRWKEDELIYIKEMGERHQFFVVSLAKIRSKVWGEI